MRHALLRKVGLNVTYFRSQEVFYEPGEGFVPVYLADKDIGRMREEVEEKSKS